MIMKKIGRKRTVIDDAIKRLRQIFCFCLSVTSIVSFTGFWPNRIFMPDFSRRICPTYNTVQFFYSYIIGVCVLEIMV